MPAGTHIRTMREAITTATIDTTPAATITDIIMAAGGTATTIRMRCPRGATVRRTGILRPSTDIPTSHPIAMRMASTEARSEGAVGATRRPDCTADTAIRRPRSAQPTLTAVRAVSLSLMAGHTSAGICTGISCTERPPEPCRSGRMRFAANAKLTAKTAGASFVGCTLLRRAVLGQPRRGAWAAYPGQSAAFAGLCKNLRGVAPVLEDSRSKSTRRKS